MYFDLTYVEIHLRRLAFAGNLAAAISSPDFNVVYSPGVFCENGFIQVDYDDTISQQKHTPEYFFLKDYQLS